MSTGTPSGPGRTLRQIITAQLSRIGQVACRLHARAKDTGVGHWFDAQCEAKYPDSWTDETPDDAATTDDKLARLDARPIGRLFGKPHERIHGVPRAGVTPVFVFCVIACIAWFLIAIVAMVSGALLHTQAHPSAIGALFGGSPNVRHVSLALFEDPVALIVMLVSLMTPVFCAAQAAAIGAIVPMVERNHRASGLEALYDVDEVNACIVEANQAFGRIGETGRSAYTFVAAAVGAIILYVYLASSGILRSWHSGKVTGAHWHNYVYSGWWASLHRPQLAFILICLGTYLFYFLGKQLAMGYEFTRFAWRAEQLGFRAVPNMSGNVDGYHGLRPLRRLTLWTYTSSLAHFIVALGVFVIWLPFSPFTCVVSVVVAVTDISVVIYPSVIAYRSIVANKTKASRRILEGTPVDQKQLDALWSTPSLPFRPRGTLTAVTIYLLFPSALVAISAVVK